MGWRMTLTPTQLRALTGKVRRYDQEAWLLERREPYTDTGIKRVLCVRCGDKANSQWQVCADQGRYRALCKSCDIELNSLVLQWANDPNWQTKMNWYRAKQEAG